MTAAQKLLCVVIALEAMALTASKLRGPNSSPLPEAPKAAIDPATAREIVEREASLRSAEPADWIQLGRVYRAFNLLAAAEFCFRAADARAPEANAHLEDWAVTLSRMGRTREAAEVAERALARGVDARELRLMLARDALREEDVTRAEKRLRELTGEPEATLLLSRLLLRTGRAREARTLLDQSLAGAPDDFRARQMRSWVAEALGNLEEARSHRQLALRCRDWGHRQDPVGVGDYQRRQEFSRGKLLGRVQELESQANWAEAADVLRQAQAIAWTDDDARRLAGFELNAGRPQRAIAELNELIALGGASGETLLALAQAWRAGGDVRQALEFATKAELYGANQSPLGNVQVQQFLGTLATERGDLEAARQHQARGQYALAKQAWLENNVAHAHQQFQRVVLLWPQHPHAWFYLGETAAILGQARLARQSYERCLQIAPDHGRASAALGRLR